MAVNPVVTAIDRLAGLTAELASAPLDDLVEPHASRAHATLRQAQDTLGLVAARVLARVEAEGAWATTPKGRAARDFDEWVAKETRGSRAGARRQTRLARAVDKETVPGLADEVAGGRVPLEHADVLTRLAPTTPARQEALSSGDPDRNAGHLLRKAGELGLDEFVKEVKRWAAKVDPTADERGHRDATERVACTLTPRDDGVAISAFMTTVDGAALDAALTAVAGVPSADDTRSHAQRMGAALGGMARMVLDHGLAAGRSGGFRPHLTVHVSWETLVAQVNALESASADASADGGALRQPVIQAGWEAAVLDDGTPIPASVLSRLACDSEVSRVVFGPQSQVLDVGRNERLYTGALRRAVVARDRHCAYPGCDRPPKYCEIHHVKHWAAHQGETSVDNGILLCWHHHDLVHSRYLTIRRDHTRGRWKFRERDGSPVLLTSPHPGSDLVDGATPAFTASERAARPANGATGPPAHRVAGQGSHGVTGRGAAGAARGPAPRGARPAAHGGTEQGAPLPSSRHTSTFATDGGGGGDDGGRTLFDVPR